MPTTPAARVGPRFPPGARRLSPAGVAALGVAAALAGCGPPTPPGGGAAPRPASRPAPQQRRDQAPPVAATAERLWQDYRTDEPAAAEMYGDRLVAVEGVVQSVTPTGGRHAVGLRTAPGNPPGVVAGCDVVPPGLTAGDRVTVVGVCRGWRPADRAGGFVVAVEHCTVPARRAAPAAR